MKRLMKFALKPNNWRFILAYRLQERIWTMFKAASSKIPRHISYQRPHVSVEHPGYPIMDTLERLFSCLCDLALGRQCSSLKVSMTEIRAMNNSLQSLSYSLSKALHTLEDLIGKLSTIDKFLDRPNPWSALPLTKDIGDEPKLSKEKGMKILAQDITVEIGDKVLLWPISFKIGPGELWLIRGPNGYFRVLMLS